MITDRLPNAEGLMLWEVHCASSYYDNDPRMPGTTPVDARFFVLATNRDEAEQKANPLAKKFLRGYKGHGLEKSVITVVPVALENFHAARDCSNDGRLGYVSTNKLSEIKLSDSGDAKHFRLGVCLIPIEK